MGKKLKLKIIEKEKLSQTLNLALTLAKLEIKDNIETAFSH